MLNDFQPPLSSKFLILHLLVYLFNVSWINQEENLAEKQEFYLYHFITFASSPTPVFTFSAILSDAGPGVSRSVSNSSAFSRLLLLLPPVAFPSLLAYSL